MIPINEQTIRNTYNDSLRDVPIYVYEVLDSTNTQLMELSGSQDLPNFTICVSEQQNAGKGRLGRNFQSPRGTGIYLSILVHADLSPLNLLTIQIAVAATKAIEKLTDREPKIKWVNDLYVNNKKVSGILAQGVVEDGELKRAIVGIGINVSTPNSAFTPELQSKAGSLEIDMDRNLLIGEIVNEFREIIIYQSPQETIEEYKSRCFILGEEVSFEMEGNTYTGTAVDINMEGHLMVQTSTELMELSAGEISIYGFWSK